ncbi:MAG: hypothetical protein FVQ83_01345 [Chloroflexi bacterium]|nr:hypothetical protein [Chloroflexota bacterium]
MEEKNEWQERTRNLVASGGMLRLMGWHGLISITTLLFGGFAIYFIVCAFMSGIIRFAPYWKPAYIVFNKMTGLPENSAEFIPPPVRWWFILTLGLLFGITLTYLGAGVWMLLKFGFLGQNLIYMLWPNK